VAVYKVKCPKCNENKFWKVRRSKIKCKKCGYEFKPKLGNVGLSKYYWKALLKWFLRCQSANAVCEETGISKIQSV